MKPSTRYNPDVLTCLANLSSDEVFTPPALAAMMLDMLPQELFRSTETRFLDPSCKSGVFLREIARRLMDGISDKIPDARQRAAHILTHQVFGIAVSSLTALVSRRSLYGSRSANGRNSLCTAFTAPDGNIRYRELPPAGTESRAYEFIHTDNPQEIFSNMFFDVVIGNPPYQLDTAGNANGAQAAPIYQAFALQAMRLQPRYLVMITPSRWFAGGWGLDEFRDRMITENHVSEIHDFQNSEDCFTGVEIKGGVSYFRWERDYEGPCRFCSHDGSEVTNVSTRYLKVKDCDILIRYNEMIEIYRKVLAREDFVSFSTIVSGRSPYGLNTNHYGNQTRTSDSDLRYFERKGLTYMPLDRVTRGQDSVYKYKLFTAKTSEDGRLPGKVIGAVTDGFPDEICSGTYLVIGPFDTEETMHNARTYMTTRFFRCLVAMYKVSQNSYAKVYTPVPMQDFSHPWTDAMLYEKYGLTDSEVAFIERMIKPME